MVGKFAYEGIKAFLTEFFEPNKKYSKDYLQEVIENFYDETGMRLEYYGDDYDMITFLRNKIYFLDKDEKGYYSLSENGKRFRSILLSDEKKFKTELFKWMYKKSRTRFRSLYVTVERLKEWLSEKGQVVPNKDFPLLIDKILGKHKFNEGVISLLEAVGLFKRSISGYELNRRLLSLLLSEEEELEEIYSLLKSASEDNRILYNDAIAKINRELGKNIEASEEILDKMEDKGMLIIRSTRGGKHVEL